MSSPSSFCTIATVQCRDDLIGLILSLWVHHPGTPIICYVDSYVETSIKKWIPWMLDNGLQLHVKLNDYIGMTRKIMEAKKVWLKFMQEKMNVMELALSENPDTLFLDSDIVLLSRMEVQLEKHLGVSPQYMNVAITDRIGYYNGGMIWTDSSQIVADWRKLSNGKTVYFDQSCIEDLVNEHKNDTFMWGENYNLSSWRYSLAPGGPNNVISKLSINGRKIMYNDLPLTSVHTHFHEPRFSKFNSMIIENLYKCGAYIELSIIQRIIYSSWVISIPKQPHNNESFREIPQLWNEAGFDVSIDNCEESGHCFLFKPLILYMIVQIWIG